MHALRSRPWLVGALSGLLVFAAFKTLDAQGAFGIADIAANPMNYWGKQVSVTGVAGNVRQHEKYMGRQKAKLNVVTLTLYESSGNPKHPRGKRSVTVTVPVEAVGMRLPAEDAPFTATGVLRPPISLGEIEPE